MRCTRSLLLLITALLAGCETVVDVVPPPYDPQLVAQSFFTADSLWAVRVTHTVPFIGAATPGFVEDATVEIWEGDRLVAQPTRADSGTYVATGRGAAFGKTYTLHVVAPGFEPVEGSDALPLPAQLLAFQESSVQEVDDPERRRRTRIEITLVDPTGEQFYGLFVVQVRASQNRATGQVQQLPPSLFPFESDDIAFGESELDFLDTDKTVFREAFFTDEVFDETTYTLDFDILYDAAHPGAEVILHRGFVVVLLAVSEDFYRYWETAGDQAFANENPFAEPVRVHSNLTDGLGVFAGFQYRLLPLGADSLSVGGYGLEDLCHLLGAQLPICLPGLPAPPAKVSGQ